MKKILIVSTSFEEEQTLAGIAQHHNPGAWRIQTTASFAQDAAWWLTHMPDLLLIRLPSEDLLQSYFFTKIRRDLSKSQKILFLSPMVSSALMQISTEFSRVRMLKTPVEGFTLYKAVEDILKDWDPEKRQIHPRYRTDIKIEVRSDFKEGVNLGIMRNLSLTGAYLEIFDPAYAMVAGDFIHLGIPLSSGKQYVFDAKVVWGKPIEVDPEVATGPAGQQDGAQGENQKDPGDSEKMFGFGVMFIDKEDVYKNLLKGF